MIYITAIHMSNGGTRHEHIASVKWEDAETGKTGESTREAMVDWINEGADIHVRDEDGHDVPVRVVDASPPYIRTQGDEVGTDNLLALPRY